MKIKTDAVLMDGAEPLTHNGETNITFKMIACGALNAAPAKECLFYGDGKYSHHEILLEDKIARGVFAQNIKASSQIEISDVQAKVMLDCVERVYPIPLLTSFYKIIEAASIEAKKVDDQDTKAVV